jgi:hypothetical protein
MVFKRKYREKIIPYILSKYCVKESLQITVGKGCDRREHRTPLYKSTQGYATTPLYREMSGILIYRSRYFLSKIFVWRGFQKGISRESRTVHSMKGRSKRNIERKSYRTFSRNTVWRGLPYGRPVYTLFPIELNPVFILHLYFLYIGKWVGYWYIGLAFLSK